VNHNLSNKSKNCAILLCAGKSQRMGKFDKTTSDFNSRPLFLYSLEKFLSNDQIDKIIIVASKQNKETIKENLSSDQQSRVTIIEGSNERKGSVSNAINYIAPFEPKNIIIHDSARPFFNPQIINEGIKQLKKYSCAFPVTKIVDTVKKIDDKNTLSTIDRSNLYFSQTPQFFNYYKLSELVTRYIDNFDYTDEVQLFEKEDIKVGIIDGNILNHKITYKDDLIELDNVNFNSNLTGISSDVHKLKKGEKLFLGGLLIPSEKGLLGHSDGDVVLHAICDAILGASSNGDLGKYYPSSNQKWKNASSKLFLKNTLGLIKKENKQIKNIDIQIIIQEPKLAKYLESIEENISKLLNLNSENINVKVTTTDKLGLIGSGDGIGTLCAVNLIKL